MMQKYITANASINAKGRLAADISSIGMRGPARRLGGQLGSALLQEGGPVRCAPEAYDQN